MYQNTYSSIRVFRALSSLTLSVSRGRASTMLSHRQRLLTFRNGDPISTCLHDAISQGVHNSAPGGLFRGCKLSAEGTPTQDFLIQHSVSLSSFPTLQHKETKAQPQENTALQLRRMWTGKGKIARRLQKYRIVWLMMRSMLSYGFRRCSDVFLFCGADYACSQAPWDCLKFHLLHDLASSNL